MGNDGYSTGHYQLTVSRVSRKKEILKIQTSTVGLPFNNTQPLWAPSPSPLLSAPSLNVKWGPAAQMADGQIFLWQPN